jgi:hypothetical protein
MDLSGRAVRDAATSVPGGYSPPDLFTGALQHTDPTLTWDETDKRRKKVCAGARAWGQTGVRDWGEDSPVLVLVVVVLLRLLT